MDTQERIICRLCFKVCDSFKAIEGELKDVLYRVLKKIDLTAIREPIMCTYCAAMLIKCSQFKKTCVYARDYVLPFINNDDEKLNLKEVYFNMSENDISEDQDICGFCMSPVKSCSAISFDAERGDIMLYHMIEQCLPELDFTIIKKLVICATCHDNLKSCFCFVTNCTIVEEKISKYRETQVINGKGQIELSSLFEFVTRDVTIKVEKEDADEEEISDGGDVLKPEQIFFDINERVKENLEIKNESYTEMDENFTPKNMLACEEGTKIEKTFCAERELKEEHIDVVDEFNNEFDMKTEECDFSRSENEVLSPPEVPTKSLVKQKCLMPDLEKELSKSYIKQKANKSISMITVYKCDSCSFQTKNRSSLYLHSLMHKDPSEVTMYKCETCLYQTNRKSSIKMHLLTHKDPSEVTIYKCDTCLYQTIRKYRLEMHLLTHKDPSEVTMYKCSLCSFQTKLKMSLKPHLLQHKDPSEVTMYKCDSCLYQTKHKGNLKKHLLKHKDPSEVTMYKCANCLFQTIRKSNLNKHLLKHKDPSEVTMYKCDTCLYQTIRKSNLKIHLLKHNETDR